MFTFMDLMWSTDRTNGRSSNHEFPFEWQKEKNNIFICNFFLLKLLLLLLLAVVVLLLLPCYHSYEEIIILFAFFLFSLQCFKLHTQCAHIRKFHRTRPTKINNLKERKKYFMLHTKSMHKTMCK